MNASKRPGLTATIKKLNSEKHLALFLGAGVSKGCGLPGWDELVEKVIDKSWGPKNSSIDILKNQNKLFASRYARNRAKTKFNKIVSDCLYESNYEISDTLRAIANSGISNICTMNFDDLLEEAFLHNAIEPNVIELGGEYLSTIDHPNIFHPHGLLERNTAVEELSKKSIVFSEDDYHALYSDPYSWANLTQISLLISHSVLFVGLSLTDPNLRRLIDVTRKHGFVNQHFALIRDPCRGKANEELLYLKKVKK